MGKKQDINEKAIQNNEWILCITDFDISSLPPDKVNISDIVLKKMVDKLTMINYRARVSSEYAFYEKRAWTLERYNAARALASKMEERSQVLFRGEPNWQYRQNIARIDTDLEKLRAALYEIENNAPVINREPDFNLSRNNLNHVFPAAPLQGGENRFCATQGADAFLAGSITDFHGRYFLTLKLYTVYTQSFVWQDNMIFSHEDIEEVLDEITRKLLVVLSGGSSAVVAVKTEPEDTLVLINRSFAGRGETGILEYPPGTVLITATAPDHDSLSFETELVSGELALVNIRLNAIEYGDVNIISNKESRVYHGALYVGETPMTLRLPVNHLEYIEIETTNTEELFSLAPKERGTIVFQTPDYTDFSQSFSLRTSVPLHKDRVDRERNGFYWALGGIWVTGIATWISYYSLSSINFAVNSSGSRNQQLYNEHNNMLRIYNASLISLGAVSVYGIYRFARYLYYANAGATPVAAPGRN